MLWRGDPGNDWKEIALKMNRTASSVRDHYRFVISRRAACGTKNYVQWTKNEEEALAKLVYESTGAREGTDVQTGVKWELIAAKMRTRTALQCAQKWHRVLNPKLRDGAGAMQWGPGKAWKPNASALLLDVLEQSGASDETEISWRKIETEFAVQGTRSIS